MNHANIAINPSPINTILSKSPCTTTEKPVIRAVNDVMGWSLGGGKNNDLNSWRREAMAQEVKQSNHRSSVYGDRKLGSS